MLRALKLCSTTSFGSWRDDSEAGYRCSRPAGTFPPRSVTVCAALLTIATLCPLDLGAAPGAERPSLVFLGDKDYPPVAYLDNGVARGMDVDLAQALAVPMKRGIRVELMDWNLAQEKVLKGEADGLLGLSVSEERRKLYDFASPTFAHEFGLVVRSSETTIRDVSDLNGKKVGVTAGGFPRKFMEERPGLQLVLINNYEDGLDRLLAGTIDTIAADLWVAAYLIEKGGIRGVSIVGKPFATAQGAIAVRKGNLALVNEINRAIDALKSDGSISKIQDNWRPQEMLFASRARVRTIVTLATGVFLVILFGALGIWIFTLKRHMRIRKSVEAALRESEARLRTFTEASFEGIGVCEDGILVDVNEQLAAMLGHGSRSEMIGKKVLELVAPESRELVRQMTESGRAEPYEHLAIRKDGSVFPVEVCGRTLSSSPHHVRVTVVRDITARKQSENHLKTLTERLRLAAATAAIAVWDWDLRTNEVVWDDRAFEIYGLPPDPKGRITYQIWADRVHPEDLPGQESALKQIIAEKRQGFREFRILRPDGSVRHVQAAEAVISNESGTPVRMVGVNIDITDRKQAEQALRESEERYRAVVEFSPECVAISVEDRLVYLNPAGAKLIGAKGAEDRAKLIGRSVYEFVPATVHELARERRREVLESGIVAPPMESALLRHDGSSIIAEALAVPFVYAGQPAILNLIRDITDRKRAETERQQATTREQEAREEFTQQLIASQEAERTRIAGELHDSLGQNLLLIKNRAHLALADRTVAADSRTQLEGISDLVAQAIAEVRQISHDLHPYQLDHLGLTHALEAMIDNAAQSSRITFERKLDAVDDLFPAEAATNLYRVVQESTNNILKHSQARQARVVIERDVCDVRVLIEDDGRGFVAGERKAIGFGLKNIAERVRILGGKLRLDSKPGAGTRLEVTIRFRPGNEQELCAGTVR